MLKKKKIKGKVMSGMWFLPSGHVSTEEKADWHNKNGQEDGKKDEFQTEIGKNHRNS